MKITFKGSYIDKVKILSGLLLLFMFTMLSYSIYKLNDIDNELKELSQIDLPITYQVNELEMLQSKQLLIIELARLSKLKHHQANEEKLQSDFALFTQKLNERIEKIQHIIESGLNSNKLLVQREAHLKAFAELEHLIALQLRYEVSLGKLLRQSNVSEADWNNVEQLSQALDERIKLLTRELVLLTEDVADYAEKHERDFILVNSSLGIVALILGVMMTRIIITSFKTTLARIQVHIDQLRNNVHNKGADKQSEITNRKDELQHIESTLSILSEKVSKELMDRREVERELVKLATKDPLTGAYNRYQWENDITSKLALAKRGNPFSVLLCDIDFFKQVNDTHGHQVGDMALVGLVELLTTIIRENDAIYRLGGEEFALLFAYNTTQEALNFAERIRMDVQQSRRKDCPPITVSIGVAFYKDTDTEDSLLRRADAALYLAKSEGRNCVRHE